MSSALEADDSDEEPVAESDDAVVSILTNGDPIRSFGCLLDAVDDECKLRLDEDGAHVQLVDPAHVLLLDLTAHASGFERFDVEDDVVFGCNIDRFRNAIGWARKRSGDGDPVAIEVFEDPARMRVRVNRPDQQITRVTEWFGIDPDSLRESPEVPDLDLPNRATPEVEAFNEAVKGISDNHDNCHVTRDDETFIIASHRGGHTGPEVLDVDDGSIGDAMLMPNAAWDTREDGYETCSSIFSIDYLSDAAAALKRSKADRVTISWGDEFPTRIAFEHEEWGFEGEFFLAPRIGGDR